jgi:predicted transcriptional regulator
LKLDLEEQAFKPYVEAFGGKFQNGLAHQLERQPAIISTYFVGERKTGSKMDGGHKRGERP